MQPAFASTFIGLAAATVMMRQSAGEHSMGFIGCSMAENVAQGYVADGGKHMWGPYGTGGLVVQSWTNTNSAAWGQFDRQSAQYGKPSEVWVQVCIFQNPGATYDEVKQVVANARAHAAPGARIWITGQPVYPDNPTSCFLAGADGPQITVDLARKAGADAALNVTYPGDFKLMRGEVQDGCHANAAGQKSLGNQAIALWG
ncbi:putative exported glycine-rich protein [Rosellinia necatrix]|uniref:Putative exported glycine-rich protein n=1 Tax=Rosellinia necatrix TaxID=77044 RepID=A0A1W2TM00_ROSNE|nr:putative exported glycine-rich protein [Rosellinia necatrix]